MNDRDIAIRDFIKRMVDECGLNSKFLENKCAYEKLTGIVSKCCKEGENGYFFTESPSSLVKNGCVKLVEKSYIGNTQKRQITFLSMEDENMLHESLRIQGQSYYDGKCHLSDWKRASVYTADGVEMEVTEEDIMGGVSDTDRLSRSDSVFYDFYELLNNKENLANHPIEVSTSTMTRNGNLVTAYVQRETVTYTAYQRAIKTKDAGDIKLGDIRSSNGIMHGYTDLIGRNEKINEYNLSNPYISLPKDPTEYAKEVAELRKKYMEYEPDGVVSQAIMKQELEKRVGKEEFAEISKNGLQYMKGAYQKLQDLQRERDNNEIEH